MRQIRIIRKTLAFQVAAFIIGLSVIIFLVMLLSHNFLIRKVMMHNAEDMARSVSLENVYRIENVLSRVENHTKFVNFTISHHPENNNHVIRFITQLLLENRAYKSIAIAYDPDLQKDNPHLTSGLFYLENSTLIQTPFDVTKPEYIYEDWYAIPVTVKTPYWTEPWFSNAGRGNLVSSFAIPIVDEGKGIILGVVRIDVSLQVMQSIVSSIRMLSTGYAFLISHNGTIVTHPADSLIMNYSVYSYAQQIGSKEIILMGKDMAKGGAGFKRLITPYRLHDKRWVYYSPVSKNGWSIGVVFSENELFSDLRRISIIFSLILCIGFFFIVTIVYYRIVLRLKPLTALLNVTNRLGTGDFEAELPILKSENEISELTLAFVRMQQELKTYLINLVNINKAKEKIETEIRIAAEVQKNLIPSNVNHLNGITELGVYGVFQPAGEVGGDLYDVFQKDKYHVCFAIADVFGKGIVASMIMTMVQTLLRSKAKHVDTVSSMAKEINTFLCDNNQQSNFLTLIVGFIDLRTGIVEYSNCGHTPLYLKKPNQQCLRFGETHSTALGIFPNLSISSFSLQLEEGDELIVFTDGITEAMSQNEAFFGYERLENAMCGLPNPDPETVCNSILSAVRRFTGSSEQSDDISILVIKYNHPQSSD
jgi:sigma-B regulation protein RsbU (phosphoserine phosphatase)